MAGVWIGFEEVCNSRNYAAANISQATQESKGEARMSTARILVKQGTETYRFLRVETSTDGSLVLFLDREPRPLEHGMTLDSGTWKNGLALEGARPYVRFTLHTSGVIHRYEGGQRRQAIYIEPLHALTRLHQIGFISIPRPSRLDQPDRDKDGHDVAGTLELPEDVSTRITFVIEIGPNPQAPQTFGLALNYELYSIVVRIIPTPVALPPEQADHFLSGMPASGAFDKPQTDKARAELAFYQAVHGNAPPILREDSGAYVALAAVPMREAPKLKIGFDRADLCVEQIPFDYATQPTHKVRFWICDKGGRNKNDDLRDHITSVELDARL